MSLATRVDIGEEIDAIIRGECCLCRIGGRHGQKSTCEHADYWNNWWTRFCASPSTDLLGEREDKIREIRYGC